MKTLTKILISIGIIGLIVGGLYYVYTKPQDVQAFPSRQGLVLELNMDDNAGTTDVADSSVENNTCTFSDAGGDPNTNAHSEVSLHQRALTFDGTDDYINCGNDPSLNITDAITIEAWVKCATDPRDSNQILITKGIFNGVDIAYNIYMASSDDSIYFRINDIGNPSIAMPADMNGNWYHIVGTYDKDAGVNNANIYLNGVVGTPITRTNSMDILPDGLFVGRDATNDVHFNGSIDGVKIYNRALSAEEIAHSYFMGSATRLRNCTLRNVEIH